MNLDESKELLNELVRCKFKESDRPTIFLIIPNIRVYDEIAEGVRLFIDASIIDETAFDCIKTIIEKRKLSYHWITLHSQKGLEIYSPRPKL